VELPRDGTALESELAVVGPPWRIVADPRAVLAAQGVRSTCGGGHLALAAFSPSTGRLERARTPEEVEQRARILAAKGDGSALILQGVIRTGANAYLWPIVKDRIDVFKVDNPLTRSGFADLVEQLWNGLLGDSSAAERRVARRALDRIGAQNWPTMNAAQIDRVLGGLGGMIANVPSGATRRAMTRRLEAATLNVARQSRVLANLPGVRTTFLAPEAATARALGGDAMVFITDEFGRRSDQFDAMARDIIARGTTQGVGDEVIAQRLSTAFRGRVSGRSEWYYRVVSSSAVSRARSYGQMLSYRDAGAGFYIWEAVLDERTCEVCRFLHGQRFSVGDNLARFERAREIDDPEEAINLFPWYRVVGGTTDDEGRRMGGDIHVQPRGGELGERVARVTESAMGRVDERGSFQTFRRPENAGGSEMPPAHGLCRCTTVPDL